MRVLAIVVLVSSVISSVVCRADEPRAISVTFLYSIEYTGGRGERLISPLDIFFDKKHKELYVADPGSRSLLIYDDNGSFKHRIATKSARGGASSVAVDGAGQIYVSYLNSQEIDVLDFKGEPMATLTLPGVPGVPGVEDTRVRSLDLDTGPTGEVYSLLTAGGVVKVDPAGLRHQRIPVIGKGEFPNWIMGFGIDTEGRFLLSDMRPYSVVRFDAVSRALTRYGKPGIYYGQLDRPVGVTTDKAGHIFVVNTATHKITCLTEQGEFLEEFGGIGESYGKFYFPTKIASNGHDRIYVLENGLKRIQVFEIKFAE